MAQSLDPTVEISYIENLTKSQTISASPVKKATKALSSKLLTVFSPEVHFSLKDPLVFGITQEFLASILMFMVFFPLGISLGNTWAAWLCHFFTLIVFDLATCGASVNPCVCCGLLVQGFFRPIDALVRITVQLAVASFITGLMKSALPDSITDFLGPPAVPYGASASAAFVAEATAATALMIAINLLPLCGELFKRPFIAVVLRVLMLCSAPFSGGCFNPMVALAFPARSALKWFDLQYLLIYVLAPIVGASIGGVLSVEMVKTRIYLSILYSDPFIKPVKKLKPE